MHYDVVMVGGGIVGLANALAAARTMPGARVALIEPDMPVRGASARNFGMIWPIGVWGSELYPLALRSREFWLELSESAGFAINLCGSAHLVCREDEWAVIRQFAQLNADSGFDGHLLSETEALALSPAINPKCVRGALYSPTEAGVAPAEALASIARYLEVQYNVVRMRARVARVQDDCLWLADGRRLGFGRCVVCGGAEVIQLFPDLLEANDIRLCKLQMMRLAAPPETHRLPTLLAGGLSLRHYRGFAACPGTEALRRRIAVETPELDRFGIHVLAAQQPDGEVILGDSHEYDQEVTPFDRPEIDDLILREAAHLLALPNTQVLRRWHGVYVRHASAAFFVKQVSDGVYAMLNTNGLGMTLSFGFAEQWWRADVCLGEQGEVERPTPAGVS